MTIIEHLNTLPEPYKSEALVNFKNNPRYLVKKDIKVPYLGQAIDLAFCWDETPQGHTYWQVLKIKADRNEIMSYKKYLK